MAAKDGVPSIVVCELNSIPNLKVEERRRSSLDVFSACQSCSRFRRPAVSGRAICQQSRPREQWQDDRICNRTTDRTQF